MSDFVSKVPKFKRPDKFLFPEVDLIFQSA